MTFSRVLFVVSAAVALVATAVPFARAQDGRLSLADRVSQLEQQRQQDAGTQSLNVDLLNRVNQLQTEVQTLRGMVEEQGHRLSELEQRARDQAMDFDARLSALESGGVAAPTVPSAPATPDPTVGGTLSGVVGQVANEPVPADPLPSAPAVDSTTAQAPVVPGIDAAAERAAYDQAFEALKNGQYAEAARRFQSFIDQYPSGEFAPNAQYWLGESYYVTQNYQVALEAFQHLLSSYPDSNKVPDALLKVGYSQYELKHWDEAEATLNRVIQQYPDSTVARLAQGRLRALRLENRQ